MSIFFNNSRINDWNYGDDNIVKVYRNNAVCYYKVSSTSPTAQTPCYAVVDDISQYSDTEFEDVFNLADEKWYKLNNLNQYEQYGVYGSGRNVTTYEGKLTIDGDYEYMYSASSWVNVGEVSGSTKQIIWYDPKVNNAKFNVGHYWGNGYKMVWTLYLSGSYSSDRNSFWHYKNTSPIEFSFYNNGFYYDMHNPTSTSQPSVYTGDYSYRLLQQNKFNSYENSTVLKFTFTYGTFKAEVEETGQVIISTATSVSTQSWYNGLYEAEIHTPKAYMTGHLKQIQIYDNNNQLVNDLTFVKNQGATGSQEISMYDSVLDVKYDNTTTNTPSYHIVEESGGTVYPVYYDEIQDPPNNVTFTSMAEAEAYECPWVGMTGIISNTDYLFCNTYTWLTKYAYEEVSGYLCESGNKYKKLQEYDRQLDGTMSATTTYVKGDLIEIHSSDCPQCTVNFCGVDANGNTVTVNNGTSTLSSSNWTSPYPVNGEVGAATTTIGMYCFRNISGTLSALTIGNTVTTIEHEAFMETSLITTLTIPSSVTQIDFWAFTRCNGLNEVIFEGTTPPTFTNQNSGVFHDYCPSVIYVPDSALSTYRAIDGTVWTNQSWSTDIIQPISNR